jgi:hypothetical protein
MKSGSFYGKSNEADLDYSQCFVTIRMTQCGSATDRFYAGNSTKNKPIVASQW